MSVQLAKRTFQDFSPGSPGPDEGQDRSSEFSTLIPGPNEAWETASRRWFAEGCPPHAILMAMSQAGIPRWQALHFAFPTFRRMRRIDRPKFLETLREIGFDPEAFEFADAFLREFNSREAIRSRSDEWRKSNNYWSPLSKAIYGIDSRGEKFLKIAPSVAEILLIRDEDDEANLGALALAASPMNDPQTHLDTLRILYSALDSNYPGTRKAALHGINRRNGIRQAWNKSAIRLTNALYGESKVPDISIPLPYMIKVINCLAKDPDPEVRILAIRISRNWPDPFVTASLCGILRMETDPRIRTELVLALQERIEDPRAQRTLLEISEQGIS